VVSNNDSHGAFGPGIDNSFGTLNVTNSTITGNKGHFTVMNGSGANGTFTNTILSNNINGGLINNGTLLMTGGTVTGNTDGGLILDGPSVINGVTVSNNVNNLPSFNGGGGILAAAFSVTVMNCLISGNSTTGPGGGIHNGGGKLTLINDTITGNSSSSGGGGVSTVDTGQANFTAINVTITGNRSNTGGGAFRQSGPMKFKNSLIAGNFFFNGTGTNDVSGTLDASSSFNLIGTGGAGGLTNGVNNNQVNVADPRLGPLADNGGPTRTFSLLSNSPALDAADNCVTDVAHCGDANIPQVTTDQRGLNRLVDGPDADTTATVDIGAYEAQPPLVNLPDASTNEDTQLLVGFDPGDTSSITFVTATSNNATLLPNDAAHLSVAVNGTTGVVTINPASERVRNRERQRDHQPQRWSHQQDFHSHRESG
jgi:trimeric autotransporter adhesin